jgi:Mor family transcriptional regulator
MITQNYVNNKIMWKKNKIFHVRVYFFPKGSYELEPIERRQLEQETESKLLEVARKVVKMNEVVIFTVLEKRRLREIYFADRLQAFYSVDDFYG